MKFSCKKCGARITHNAKTGHCAACAGRNSWQKRSRGRNKFTWQGKEWYARDLYNHSCKYYGCTAGFPAFRVRLKRWGIENAVKGIIPEVRLKPEPVERPSKKIDLYDDEERLENLENVPEPTYYDLKFNGPDRDTLTYHRPFGLDF